MAYSENLAEKVRNAIMTTSGVEEKRMMGGLTFMVNGKMCVGVVRNDLMVRLDPAVYDAALKKQGCREMDFTGKPMRGFVFVSPDGTSKEKDLNYWLDLALDFNKKARSSKRRK